MTIVASSHFKKKSASLIRQVKKLAKAGLIPVKENSTDPLQVVYAIDIQIVKEKEIAAMNWKLPEGVRLLLQQGNSIVAALDFRYTHQQVRFSHIVTGNALHTFTAAIAALQQKKAQGTMHSTLTHLQFLLAEQVYLVQNDPAGTSYFQYSNQGLKKISRHQLQSQLQTIFQTRQNDRL